MNDASGSGLNGRAALEKSLGANHYRLEQQANFFSEATDIHGDLPPAYIHWSKIFVETELFDLFGARDAVEFYVNCISDYRKKFNKKSTLRIASIGCGEAKAEIQLCKSLQSAGINELSFSCVDIAAGAVERARSAAENSGVAGHFVFSVMDFDEFFVNEKFDVVIAHQVLHHVVDLEGLFDKIKRSIDDDGVFLTVDMIGRNGHMLWPEALVIFDRLWKGLPREYKFNRGFDRYEDVFSNWDHSKEGNEGIRAQDVLVNLTRRFVFDRFFATGCLAPTLFGRQFGANFDPTKLKDRELIELVGRLDRDLIDIGYLKPVLMYAMMSNRQLLPQTIHRHWSPEFCCRDARDYSVFDERVRYVLGERLNFGERQGVNVFLVNGWSSPEPMGVWSNDGQSTISISLTHPAPSRDLVLTIEGCGHVCPEKPLQVVDVSVNGSRVGGMQFTRGGAVEVFRLQIGRIAEGADTLHIEFSYSDARSPLELKLSNDIRRIAFFLHGLSINAVGN